MVDHFGHTGLLPIWTLWGQETSCMIGNHSIPILVDAFFKGQIPEGQTEKLWQSVLKTSTINSLYSDWSMYDRFGYLPCDSVTWYSVSTTLEVSFDDWCVAQLAKKLGKEKEYEYFMKRSRYYQNLFDPKTRFFRAKDSKGNWQTNFNSLDVTHTQGYTEANAWQYLWYVPQDVPELINLLGGREKFVEKLDSLFSLNLPIVGEQADVSGLIGQYAHGNEPSHHVAYLYNYAGRYDKTQSIVRRIIESQYNNQPDGLAGNEDCGQMSAWYILSAMGFYPVNPASGRYDLGIPIVKKVTINLPDGKKLTIKNELNNSKSLVESIWLNGVKYKELWITHEQIMEGGELIFK
jgi:predicted alpha-1,2-mannosidase